MTTQNEKKEEKKFDAAAFIKQSGSKSQAIRLLRTRGLEVGEIAALLGIKYQHARNVLITPVKNPGKSSKGSKKVLSADTLAKAASLMK